MASIGREVDYLTQRAKTSSERERSAWLFRCIVSCALVIAEYFFLYVFLSRRDTLLALGSSWLVLLLLPRPTPRIPLFAGRCLAFVVTIANASVGLDWLGRALPAINTWGGILWFVSMGALVWAFMALRPRSPMQVQASMSRAEEVQGGAGSQWSNVPTIGFADVGGAARIKDEIRIIAENRFGKNAARVIRNGILLQVLKVPERISWLKLQRANLASTSITSDVRS